MKSFKTLPTNGDFFARYANLVPTLYKVGYLSQTVSGLTEIGIIYSIAYARLYSFFPLPATITLAVLASLIGMGLLEVGLRKFVPYGVRAFLYKRCKGLDLAMSIFILLTTSALLYASGILSFKNSHEIIESFEPEPEQKNTKEATVNYNTERERILLIYRSDSSTIAQTYNTQINAKNTEYQSLISVKEKDIERYERKEKRTGESYKTKKIMIGKAIKQLEANRDAQIVSLEIEKGKELKTLLMAKNKDIGQEKKILQKQMSSVENFNKKEQDKADNKIKKYGGGLGWFTVFCLFVFVLSVVLDEIHKKGSGIEIKILPSQYDFSTSIVAEFLNAVSNKVQYKLRSRIARLEENTPPPPLPIAPTGLYDLSKLKQDITTILVEQGDEKARIVYLNNENRYNDFRLEDDKNSSAKLRNCVHCNDEYIYKHHKQKYCSDKCRMTAWEKRTGRRLNVSK